MEFIVAGAPRSANARPRSRRQWRERVAHAAQERLLREDMPTDQDLAILVVYFYRGETTIDVDNIGKALLDGLKGVLYDDDRQVSELTVRKSRLSAGVSLTGASPYLLEAIERMLQSGSDFVYVRASAAPDHGRIP
ncbi:MAG TPA: RusA family crossover junction endodeoxyribonuclease [Stellaceae bacterium]|jgi:hypothetical protein|nr:RusA family crossover junction endodeoxyribonuclease [Stellaceae bacterium]